MSITELGNLAQWLEVTQSVVAIIGLPILTLTLLMIGRQAQYAHHRYMPEYPWYVWERSLRDIYNQSPILQQFLHEHPDWYTDEVHRILTGRSPTRCARPSS